MQEILAIFKFKMLMNTGFDGRLYEFGIIVASNAIRAELQKACW